MVAVPFEPARYWLSRNLFPDSPSPSGTRARRVGVVALVAALITLIQLVRIWSSAPLNSIWLEDGNVFLADALRWGFLHALATPFDGYLNITSRLVAEPVSMLPVEWFAPAMAICGAAITTGCALVVWKASAGHIENVYLRGTLVALMVLLPVVSVEMLDDVTYSIWYLLFASFWVLLWRPASLAGAVGGGALLCLTALSNALIVFFVPLWLLRVCAIRDRRDVVIVSSFAIGVATQFALSWDQRGLLGERGSQQIAQAAQWHWSLVPAYFQRIVGGAVTGQWITGYLWVHLGTVFEGVLIVGFIAFLVLCFVGTAVRTCVLALLAVAISLAMFIFSGYQREVGSQFYWPPGTSNAIGSHYMVVPTLLLLSALLIRLDAKARARSTVLQRDLRIGVVSLVVLAALLSFKVVDSAARGQPAWSSAITASRAKCFRTNLYAVTVPISPPNIYNTGMTVPCSKLIGSELTAGRHPLPPDPHTTILRPLKGMVLSGEVVIHWVATDNVPLTKSEIWLSGATRTDELLGLGQLTPGGYVRHWNTRRVPNGVYILRSVAYDAGGLTRSSKGVAVIVKN